jgi:hypothetical protein
MCRVNFFDFIWMHWRHVIESFGALEKGHFVVTILVFYSVH